MKLSDFLKSPSSFRAQMVAFIALMLALTMAVISFYNQRLEERTTRVVNEYIREIPLATDLVYRSLSKAENLYDLVNQPGQNSLAVNSESNILHIFIVDEEGKIFDSTDKKDIERVFAKEYPEIAQSISTGDLRGDVGKIGGKQIINGAGAFTAASSKFPPFTSPSLPHRKVMKPASKRARSEISISFSL